MIDFDFYNENGYFILENVFTDDECAAFIEAAKGLENYRNGTHRPAMMPHRENPLYLQAMNKKIIVDCMRGIFNGTPMGLQTEFFYCKPGTRGFSMHQDNFFVQAPVGQFASAWCALTDTYAEKGGLIVYPGTHKEGLLPVRKLELAKDAGQDPNANNEESIVPPQYKAVNASVPKGAVLFIDSHIVHGSNPNTTADDWRYVLLMTYLRQGAPFRAGQYAQREPISLEAA